MKLLFIDGGSRLKLSKDGRWFTDGTFTEEVWNRYISICQELTIILRKEPTIYENDDAKRRFSPIPISNKVKVVALEDILKPICNLLDINKRKQIEKTIFEEIKLTDKCIIRSASFYTLLAYKACIKYNKPYLLEVTGFAKEGLSHHSILGQLSANYFENVHKEMASKASCAIYVTEEALQKRYPCKNGKMLGCSDVDIEECDEQLLQKRTSKILCNSDKIVLGTIAFLDVKWKGQANVIKAIAHLKKQGITNVFYEMVGLGTGDALVKLAKKLNVADKVKILGAKNHEDIFRWLDSIDIYVQPSYQEGLCRAIVEAMSRAAPVICSDVGGNFELIDKKYLFKAGDDKRIAELIEIMLKENIEQSTKNFQRARKYEKRALESKRLNFLQDFMRL